LKSGAATVKAVQIFFFDSDSETARPVFKTENAKSQFAFDDALIQPARLPMRQAKPRKSVALSNRRKIESNETNFKTTMTKIKTGGCALLFTSLLAFGCSPEVFGGSRNRPKQSSTAKSSATKIVSNHGAQTGAPVIFKGFVNAARFEMTLRRAGDKLSGDYFYLKSGGANKLNLSGAIDQVGKFTLRETDSSGSQTGEFKGVWKNDSNEATATLVGEWRKPNAKESQFFVANEQAIMFTGDWSIKTRKTTDAPKGKRFEAITEYPELTGGTAATALKFNQIIKTLVTKPVAAFEKEISTMIAEDTLNKGVKNVIEINYDIVYADDDLISVNFLESTFTGGAHGNYTYFTVNYDLKNNRKIQLADLFQPRAKYLETVAAAATRDLQNRKAPDSTDNLGYAQDIFKEGALPTAENYQSWNLSRKGLLITFAPYQVASFADGTQTVIVPYAQLKNIAKPDGVLWKFLK
jgi:hypothetical protein